MNKHPSLPILPLADSLLTPSCEAMLAAMEDGVCVQTLEGRVIRTNEAFATMLGLPVEKIIGNNCSEVFGCSDENGILPHFCARQSSFQTGEITVEEIRGHRLDQRLRSRVSPVRDDAGKIVAFVMVVRDITEIAARERELAHIGQMVRLGELAAGLAHEIKNPLAGIQGVVDIMIQRRNPNDPEREVLENVRHEVGRIDATIHTLLDRAKPREFNFQSASLNEVVHRAISMGRYQAAYTARKRGDQIQVEFSATPTPIVMKIDVGQIEDAILNLISNAIEAIETHGTISIRFNEGPETNEVMIEIKDTGRGISAENLEHIFSPFFTTNANGTGLGLPAVQRIARAHGGRVEVSSTVGEGSIFTLHLPRQTVS